MHAWFFGQEIIKFCREFRLGAGVDKVIEMIIKDYSKL